MYDQQEIKRFEKAKGKIIPNVIIMVISSRGTKEKSEPAQKPKRC